MKKVFCENCKFYYNKYRDWVSTPPPECSPHQCGHPSNTKKYSTPIRKSILCKKSADKINKNNNCKNYKKQQWYHKLW